MAAKVLKRNGHVILGVTGSVAATRTEDIVRALKKAHLKVSVVLTRSAEYFVSLSSLKKLVDNRVYQEMFVEKDGAYQMPHIELAKEADAVLIAPATANIIGKMAHGLADDLLTCIVLATSAKVMMAPAMNTEMYTNQLVQQNILKLKEQGIDFIGPVEGELACGDVGLGHISETEDMVFKIKRSLKIENI